MHPIVFATETEDEEKSYVIKWTWVLILKQTETAFVGGEQMHKNIAQIAWNWMNAKCAMIKKITYNLIHVLLELDAHD